MTILRIFIKPNGLVWLDYQMSNNVNLGHIVDVWKRDGFLNCQNSGLVPWESWLYAATLQMPSAILLPGEKPN